MEIEKIIEDSRKENSKPLNTEKYLKIMDYGISEHGNNGFDSRTETRGAYGEIGSAYGETGDVHEKRQRSDKFEKSEKTRHLLTDEDFVEKVMSRLKQEKLSRKKLAKISKKLGEYGSNNERMVRELRQLSGTDSSAVSSAREPHKFTQQPKSSKPEAATNGVRFKENTVKLSKKPIKNPVKNPPKNPTKNPIKNPVKNPTKNQATNSAKPSTKPAQIKISVKNTTNTSKTVKTTLKQVQRPSSSKPLTAPSTTLSKPVWAKEKPTTTELRPSSSVPFMKDFMKETSNSRRRTLEGREQREKVTGDPTHYSWVF